MGALPSRAITAAGMLLGLLGLMPPVQAEQVLTFGDSLSKEYYIEFASDEYPDNVVNWAEILDDERNGFFDYGSEEVFFDLRAPGGHEYNWSIPGGKIERFVELVRGETETPGFPPQEEREVVSDQLDEVERFVIFVGGNDAEDWYDDAYDGMDIGADIAEYMADLTEVLDWVVDEAQTENPDLQICLVGVPHVGITPKIKDSHPPGPGTDLATAWYADLNAQMAALAASRGVAFMDIFSLNLVLLDAATFCYQGKSFINDEDEDGDHDYVWLGGPAADGYHPNTIAQAIIANEILKTFNAFYGSEIRWLTTEEIIADQVGRAVDIPFTEWLACYGFAGAAAGDDPNGDGVSLLAEFGLGMDPRGGDLWRLPVFSLGPDGMGGSEIRLIYRPRLANPSTQVEVVPQWGTDLAGWTDAVPGQVTQNPDGSLTARFPATGLRMFERVLVRLLP